MTSKHEIFQALGAQLIASTALGDQLNQATSDVGAGIHNGYSLVFIFSAALIVFTI